MDPPPHTHTVGGSEIWNIHSRGVRDETPRPFLQFCMHNYNYAGLYLNMADQDR